MARIAGSPLGLVGLQSNDTNKVFENYNNRTRNSGTKEGMVSLFSGDRIVRPFGFGLKGGADDINGSKSFDNNTPIHSNDLYNTTIDNIVDKLKGTKAELNFLDFAYLKDVGVYPNNRLMVARRFATPQLDNIMYNKKDDERGSLVTLISWRPTGEDFLEISFGEEGDDPHGQTVDATINDFAISNLPKGPPQPLRRAQEDHIVDFIKIPFVQ